MTQNVRGSFKSRFRGNPLASVSRTDLEAGNSLGESVPNPNVARIRTLHITPFFGISIVNPRAKVRHDP